MTENKIVAFAGFVILALISLLYGYLLNYEYFYEVKTQEEAVSYAAPDIPSVGAGEYTLAEFAAEYGDSYDMQVQYRYDKNIKRGEVIRLTYTYEKNEPFLWLDVSMGQDYMGGSERCDFTNLIDPQEYFVGENIPDNVIFYNEFYVPDGSKRRVQFYNVSVTGGKKPYIKISKAGGNETAYPCAYDDRSYSFDRGFSLTLEDYNGDGRPDFLYRASDPENGGCYYRMHLTDTVDYPNALPVDSNMDDVLFIYNETADSPRLDRLDRNGFFYLTKDESDRIVPMVISFEYPHLSVSDYENNGWVFTSFYEGGCIRLKATAVSEEAVHDEHFRVYADVSLKQLDGMVWRDVPMETDRVEFTYSGMGSSDEAVIEMKLPRGVYRLEVSADGEYSCTEFFVRSDKSSEPVTRTVTESETDISGGENEQDVLPEEE